MRIAGANVHPLDVSGHHSRADVIRLSVDRRRLGVAELGEEPVSLD
jgi:hypothetical protein